MPPLSSSVQTLADTHGLVTRPGTRISASSEHLGWRSLFASAQHEAPFEDYCRPVADPLVVVHLSGPVRVTRRLGGRCESRVVPQGGAFIMPDGADFGVQVEGELDTVHFYLHRKILDEVAEDDATGRPELLPRLGTVDPYLQLLADELRRQMEDPGPATRLYVDHVARLAASRLLRAHSNATIRPSNRTARGLSEARLRHALEFIDAHLDSDIALEQLAEATGLSPTYFARQFRISLGVAPHQYLQYVRVERARRLLAGSVLPIATIALECGFCHQEHLTRVFGRLCGTTPAAYRQSLR